MQGMPSDIISHSVNFNGEIKKGSLNTARGDGRLIEVVGRWFEFREQSQPHNDYTIIMKIKLTGTYR